MKFYRTAIGGHGGGSHIILMAGWDWNLVPSASCGAAQCPPAVNSVCFLFPHNRVWHGVFLKSCPEWL